MKFDARWLMIALLFVVVALENANTGDTIFVALSLLGSVIAFGSFIAEPYKKDAA